MQPLDSCMDRKFKIGPNEALVNFLRALRPLGADFHVAQAEEEKYNRHFFS